MYICGIYVVLVFMKYRHNYDPAPVITITGKIRQDVMSYYVMLLCGFIQTLL